MKIFAVLVLTAVIACASADDAPATSPATVQQEYVGYLQDAGSTDIVRIGVFTDCEDDCEVPIGASAADVQYGMPTCKLGAAFGNPLCMGKCISRGNKGGYCKGKTCKCTN